MEKIKIARLERLNRRLKRLKIKIHKIAGVGSTNWGHLHEIWSGIASSFYDTKWLLEKIKKEKTYEKTKKEKMRGKNRM